MVKKTLKIVAISLLVIILILAVTPVLFKGKIINAIKKNANKSITATLDLEDVSLSLLRNFPKASVSISGLSIINTVPFEGDTLFYAEKIHLKMSLSQLFRKEGEPMKIKSFSIDRANINIFVNEEGIASYDIAKKTPDAPKQEEAPEAGNPMVLSLEDYAISNTNITYIDAASKMKLGIYELNHSGTGDLSASQSELDTKTHALVSFSMKDVEYLTKNTIDLKALLQLDLEQNTYTFLKNEALINQLPLVFDGFVKLNENNQEVAINFKTPSSDFKNFLAVIPEGYSKNIENVETSGNFMIDGFFKGIVDDEHIPQFGIKMASENASFKYPNLPKAVSEIDLSVEIGNKTGITDDTYITIDTLSFKIDNDVFRASATLRNLIKNPYVTAQLNGRINLANLSKAYPVSLENELSGILDANISTAFDMNSISKKRYENTKNTGSFVISNLNFTSDQMSNPVAISKVDISFTTKTISLNRFDAKTGASDFNASGTIHNLLGFMFNREKLEGNFEVNSNTLAVKDFMTVSEEVETSENKETKVEPVSGETQKLKIPAFLDCTLNATANTVIYDNLRLKNVKGTVIIKDQKATIKNLSSQLFDGTLALKGEVSTQEETPTFTMNLNVNAFDIASSFKELRLFQFLTPLADAINGKLNSEISLSGNLKEDLTPQLASLSGDVLAELLNSSFATNSSPLLQSFDQKLNFIDIDKLGLKDLKTVFSFNNGKVNVKPFQLNYKDIGIEVAGSHSIDKTLEYTAKLNVPAKYLGKEAGNLLTKLSDKEASEIKVPVTVNLSGEFTNPKIATDVKSAVSDLTQQVAARQKEKLVAKGKDALTDILGGKEDTEKENSDSKKDAVKEAAKDVLGNLFGKQKKKKDSTSN